MVVKRYLEPILEPVFHEDSYGYRPGRSAHQALSIARQRCRRHDRVLDRDDKGFFDNIDWELLPACQRPRQRGDSRSRAILRFLQRLTIAYCAQRPNSDEVILH